MRKFHQHHNHLHQLLLFTLFFISLITISTAFTPQQLSDSFTATHLLDSFGSIRIHGSIQCENECTRLELLRMTSTKSQTDIKFTSFNATFYDGTTGAYIQRGDMKLNANNEGELTFTSLTAVKSYIFDGILYYANLDKLSTFEITLSISIGQNGELVTKSFTLPLRRSSLQTKDTSLFPILVLNDPRVFRLSAILNLIGHEDDNVTKLKLTAFASWAIKLRDNAPEKPLGCYVNSVQLPTVLNNDGSLEILTLSSTDESNYGTTFGPDLSIHCPDYLLSQRYPVNSQIPSTTGAIIVDAFYLDEQTQQRTGKFSTTVWGPLYHHAPNPYLINGHLYLEPYNNFAYVRFEVFYDDEVIKSQTLTTDYDTIDVNYIDINWSDRIDYSFVPTTDITNYWQTQIKTYTTDYKRIDDSSSDSSQSIIPIEYNKQFLYKKHIFGTENYLTNYYFTAYGQYNHDTSKSTSDFDYSAIATAGIKVHSDITLEDTIVSIPYVAEVHICNQPSLSIQFYHNEKNFKIDIIELYEDTTQLTISFPRDTYRFEGQFHDCGIYRGNINSKNKKKIQWDLITTVAAIDDNGQSYGALQTLHFTLKPPEFQFFKGLSYQIVCPNGVTKVRNRNLISTKDLLSIRFIPKDTTKLINHHHLYQSTIIFTPRENTNIIMITFVTIISLAIIIGIGWVLYWCGCFSYIHRLMAPQQEYTTSTDLNNKLHLPSGYTSSD